MEITADLDLSFEEESLLNMHCVVNVFNIVVLELMRLSMLLGGRPELDALARQITGAARSLGNPGEARPHVEAAEETIAAIVQAVEKAISESGGEQQQKAQEFQANLDSVFDVLRVRARELLSRWDDPNGWVEHDIAQLRSNFFTVFRAIEKNSHGSYQLVHNIAQYDNDNYLVNFEITASKSKTIPMPAVFQDVMRDLIANARKYTEPGGKIEAGLFEDSRELRFVVSDTGRGIPADEIESSVLFGTRASNAVDKETRGGGFGLTKAYYVTRRLKGRMWVDSEVNKGTVIGIRIPIPKELVATR